LAKKRRRREKEIDLECTPEESLGFEADCFRTPTDWQVDLEAAIDSLPEDNRIVVSMFYLSDCSLAEISEYLGVSTNTVKGKLYRARQQLGKMILERYGGILRKNKLRGGFTYEIMKQLHQRFTSKLRQAISLRLFIRQVLFLQVSVFVVKPWG
jgi:predicted DNA-binding protein YlxM (UPF0122 family)